MHFLVQQYMLGGLKHIVWKMEKIKTMKKSVLLEFVRETEELKAGQSESEGE